ncbi:DNA polymerase IV [Streptococcus fryi]
MLVFPLINDISRKIIHIDMDAFFAAVEERDNPSLRGKAVVIGSDPRLSGGRGVVSTCNYIARSYGIHSAMSTKEAYERCPQAIFISGNYPKYKAIGQDIRQIFRRYTDLVEPMSIDEAYLDVTDNKLGLKSAIKIARLIQEDIWKETQLTCSAGVSYNKFLAKLASDYQKPAGLTVILPDDAQAFLAQLPIEKFHGVGQKTVAKLHDLSVFNGQDLLKLSESDLIDHFGRFGYDLYRKARGISQSPVRADRIRKSISSEKTYSKLLRETEDILLELGKHAKRLARLLEENNRLTEVIVVKIRYADFSTVTKRRRLDHPVNDSEEIDRHVQDIYAELENEDKAIRLLGITATGLVSASSAIQLDI